MWGFCRLRGPPGASRGLQGLKGLKGCVRVGVVQEPMMQVYEDRRIAFFPASFELWPAQVFRATPISPVLVSTKGGHVP